MGLFFLSRGSDITTQSLNTEAMLRFANTCENTTKKQLSSEMGKGRNKPRISKNSATFWIPICDLAILPHVLTTQPRMLKFPQKLATNNEATHAKKLPIRCRKREPNTKRHNFA